jgi:putative addiction module component (TIGR02574 family)
LILLILSLEDVTFVSQTDLAINRMGGAIMTAKTEQILTDALSLPANQRAELAERLFSSLDISQDELDRLWAQEADNRIEAYGRGQIKTTSAQQVFKNIFS